jgi:hypothetical protein
MKYWMKTIWRNVVFTLCLGVLVAGAGCGLGGEERDSRPQASQAETSECDPSYSGACLDPYVSDYDCEGGSGDGPSYTGSVVVVGDDHYGLDADGDRYGCE